MKWEYYIFGAKTVKEDIGKETLTSFGKAGWEMCGLNEGDKKNPMQIIFKRPIQD